ncbi:MAG: bifunctional alpha,alpha-trehalose-phosphate synthase (UDP-forming)/trehalose-phosphatase [Acidobacteriota bacterium]
MHATLTRVATGSPALRRTVIVSNRLPITARLDDAQVRLTPAAGGVATGLWGWHQHTDALWVGWPGDVDHFDEVQRGELEQALSGRRVKAVHLSKAQIDRYYEGFSNRVIWPLFHYLADRIPVDATGWDTYSEVNQRFADAVAETCAPGDIVWIHDYQLMLVPAMLRARRPDISIGFFLHIPFPSSEVFRILPWRRQILHGLLGADLIGFHTFAYLRHFVTSLIHIEGIEAAVDRVQVDERSVRLGVFPMGIDTAEFERLAREPGVMAEAAAIRRDAGHRRLVLGVDRLDYTKGIPRRLEALERLFKQQPDLLESVRYVQVAVPSRQRVDAYQSFRRKVEQSVGRINGAYASVRSTPIHYMHRAVSRRELVALYCAADVMLVTPLRDGMNLVAKEFVASRVDGDGVLVLSEFAGAAAELGEAVVVNPYDVDELANAIARALGMEREEREARMRSLRRRVSAHDVHLWARRFVSELTAAPCAPRGPSHPGARALTRALREIAGQPAPVNLIVTYDAVLVPTAPSPDLAVPDTGLFDLLAELAARPSTAVHLLSERSKDALERWFGALPLTLWAEHGFWCRPADGSWNAQASVPATALDRIYPILEQFTAATPGSLIERKSASVAWHYRIADPEFGERQAHELRMLLGDALSNQPLEVLKGRKAVEVRLRGVNKGMIAQSILDAGGRAPTIIAIGDDHSSEDLYAALPARSVTVAVGAGPTAATYRLSDHHAVRTVLSTFLRAATSPAPADVDR